MSEKTPIILIRSLDTVRGGITKAAITRANILAEKYNEVLIITMSFQAKHREIIQELRTRKILSKKVKVFNFFEDLKPKKSMLKIFSKTEHSTKLSEKGLVAIPDQRFKNNIAFRFYKNGIYVMYKRFSKDNRLIYIDYMDESRHRLKREEYDEQNKLVRVRHMDQKLNKPRLDRYFDANENCYMSVWIDPKTVEEKRTITFFKTPKEYSDLDKVKTAWLKSILDKINNPVVMSEQRSLDKILWKTSHKNIKKIVVVHASHLSESQVDIYKNVKSYSILFKNSHRYDRVVLLTEEQKEDIITVYGDLEQLKVVPHVYQQKKSSFKKNEFDPYLAVTLARFHKDKQLDQAIKAFSYVVKQIPSAKYHIYGYGPQKDELVRLINDLNMKNNIFLKDYTFNASEVYGTAACSILTSKREGFGMVITESMAMGTPVVSYDTKYGPKDIIDNDTNGYIISNGNQKEMAEKIVDIMTNEKLYNRLSKNALAVKNTFSKQSFVYRWMEVINN